MNPSVPKRGQKRTRQNNGFDGKRIIKNDENREPNRNQNEKPLAGPHKLGAEDHLSRLSDDCLLEILVRLPRNAIYNVMTMNKRMHPVTQHKSLGKNKWKGGELFIRETNRGYGFAISYPWKNNTKGRPHRTGYEYEVFRSDNGTFVEKDKIKMGGYVDDHDWPIPDLLFAALSKVLRFHGANSIEIENIPFEDFPWALLHESLRGSEIDSLRCVAMSCDGIKDATRISFIKLIKNIRQVNLRSSTSIPSLIDENCIRRLGDSKVRDRDLVSSKIARDVIQAHFFNAPVSLFKHLICYRNLDANAMIVNSSEVVRLLIMRMETLNGSWHQIGRWHFLIDQPLTDQQIDQQIAARGRNYEHNKSVFGIHRLSKEAEKGTDIYADFSFAKVDGYTYLHSFFVKFVYVPKSVKPFLNDQFLLYN